MFDNPVKHCQNGSSGYIVTRTLGHQLLPLEILRGHGARDRQPTLLLQVRNPDDAKEVHIKPTVVTVSMFVNMGQLMVAVPYGTHSAILGPWCSLPKQMTVRPEYR